MNIQKGDETMRYRVRYTLKQWRQLAGLTQVELAKAVGKDQTTIVRWEKGETQPKADDIAKIEQVLKIKWSDDVRMP